MVSITVQDMDIPSATPGANYDCSTDYLELRDGSDKDAKLLWRKCGTDFDPTQTYDLTSNVLHLMLKTSGVTNASFTVEHGDADRDLQLVFTNPSADGPPPSVGNDIWVPWSTIEPIPQTGTAWVGLYAQGTCDEDNEWRHKCYLGSFTLPPRLKEGVVQFPYGNNGYWSSGYYELRFFSGSAQGRLCNIQNRQMTNNDVTEYSKCQLSALARQTIYVAAAGTVPMSHVPGLKEWDHNYETY